MGDLAKRLMKDLLIICLFLALAALWGFAENHLLTVTRVSVPCAGLPGSFDGFRVAQVSDLHNTEFGPDSRRLVEKLRDCDPDIIAITGDLVDCNRTDVETALEFVRQAVRIAPCFYVTGNHESRIGNYAALEEGLISLGVTVLHGEEVTLEREGETIRLLGVDDPGFGRTVDSQLEVLSGEGFSLLLSHRPELFDTYCSHGISLALTGHAHGGQFRLPFLGGVLVPNQGLFPEYDAGLFTRETTSMYISRGLGNSVFPFRLGNPPELVLITLTSSERSS